MYTKLDLRDGRGNQCTATAIEEGLEKLGETYLAGTLSERKLILVFVIDQLAPSPTDGRHFSRFVTFDNASVYLECSALSDRIYDFVKRQAMGSTPSFRALMIEWLKTYAQLSSEKVEALERAIRCGNYSPEKLLEL